VIDNCQKCDVLIHEAYSEEYLPPAVPNWREYRSKYHTTTTQLAEIANKTQPRLLIVYHRGVLLPGREISDEQYLTEIQRTYHERWSSVRIWTSIEFAQARAAHRTVLCVPCALGDFRRQQLD
jgi:ribonuclease BN (tRNA processing enzyme)